MLRQQLASSRGQRILFVTPTYMPFVGGTSTFVHAMARRLSSDGHWVTVLTTNAGEAQDFWRPPRREGPGLPSSESAKGLTVERMSISYPWPTPYAFGLLRRLSLWLHLGRLPARLARPLGRRLSRWMPPLRGLPEAFARWARQSDLIQSEDSSWDGMLVAAAGAASDHSKPLVLRPLMHLGGAWVQAHHQMAHQVEVYRSAGAVLALSQREADALAALGVPMERLHRIPMGIDPQPVSDSQSPQGSAFRRQHGIDGPLVAFVGANTFDKGAFTLAEAVIRLNLEGQQADLVCVGPQSQALQAFLRRQRPDERSISRQRVHVLGVVDEPTKHGLLAACDLLALPSQVDTFGIVFLEAWLHGKPVIGADAGGIPDLVQHERTGLLVPFGDAEALSGAIRSLLSRPDWAKQLGAFGQQDTLKNYTWDRTYEILLGVYDALLASGA